MLCNGLVVRNGQDKLAVVGRCLNLVAYVSLVLELARIEIGWLDVVQRERNLLVLVILIIVVIVKMRALLGCDYALHELHGRIVLARIALTLLLDNHLAE